MHVTGISYMAVLLAALASLVFGGIWYGLFAKPWLRSARTTVEPASVRPLAARSFIIMLIAQFMMAWILAGILLHVARGAIPLNLRTGLVSAVLIWVGFVMSSLAANHALQGTAFVRTLIDGGHWLGVLLIQSSILVLLAS